MFAVEFAESLGLCLFCRCGGDETLVGVWDHDNCVWENNDDGSECDHTCSTCRAVFSPRGHESKPIRVEMTYSGPRVLILTSELILQIDERGPRADVVAGLLQWLLP